MDYFDVPEDELRAFFQSVGWVVVTWGIIEQTFDVCVDQLFQHGGNSIEKSQPFGLKQRIKFSTKCLDRLPRFRPVADSMQNYIDKIATYSEVRHRYIHSAITTYQDASGKIEAQRLRNQGDRLTVTDVEFDPEEFPSLIKELTDLTSLGHDVLAELLELLES